MSIEITQTITPKTRDEWRLWLSENYNSKKEIWLIYFKKHTQQPTVAYEDAVEEALCFGWIDGMDKTIDEDRYAQRFTPRLPKSKWSDINVARYRKLLAAGLVSEAGKLAFKNKSEVYVSGKMSIEGRKWHETHRMPKKANIQTRVAWHKEHQRYCSCRPVPKSLAAYFH